MLIEKSTLKFLKELSENNNREWFAEQKKRFDGINSDMKAFLDVVNEGLSESDQLEKHKLYRIYRDVRFSKNKDPYKTHFSGHFVRATSERRGGYFLSISPGETFVGGGFYSPNKEDLLRVRKEFEMDDSEIRAILKNPNFKSTFGELKGEEVKTAPRGFEKDHKAIDLIKKKNYYVMRSFSDKEVLDPGFYKEVVKTFEAIRPYFDYMSNVLTTDLNGEKLV